MQARIWGCRGSLASPGPATIRYGGNTSCIEILNGTGPFVIFDAGTGLRQLGQRLIAEPPGVVHLLLTHLHLDHLEGLGFFSPLWDPRWEVHIWGPASTEYSLEERISRLLSPPLFPITTADIPSKCSFHDVPEEQFQIGDLKVRGLLVSHPGPTLGYRLENGAKSMAYIPDHEPALLVKLASAPHDWVPGLEVAENVDVLLHDSQYTEDEYPNRKGWGHSSVSDAVLFAQISKAKSLMMFHHDPYRTDDQLELMQGRAEELWEAGGTPPALASEGMLIDLGGDKE